MSLIPPHLLLAPVDSGKDRSWPEIAEIFADQPFLEMGQTWKTEKDPELRLCRVWTGISRGNFAIYAELTDDDIFNSSRSLNERTWMTGDVFEMFLKSESTREYYEFHVTPENQKLQLHFPDVEAFRARLPWGSHCVEGEIFYSRTLVEEGRWKVYAEVPLDLFQGSPWRFSFCRYDATRGVEKVIKSSTSPHAAMDFHRPEDWGRMEEKAETLKS